MSLVKCLDKVGGGLKAGEKKVLLKKFEDYQANGLSEIEAGQSALNDFHKDIYETFESYKQKVGVRRTPYQPFDSSAKVAEIEKKYQPKQNVQTSKNQAKLDVLARVKERNKADKQNIAQWQREAKKASDSQLLDAQNHLLPNKGKMTYTGEKKLEIIAKEIEARKLKAFDAEKSPLQMVSDARPAFYSAVEKTISNSPQNKFSADQVKGLLKDTKQEERDWLGIDEFLADNPKPTKQELLDFVRGNQVEIKEVVRDDKRPKFNALKESFVDAYRDATNLGNSEATDRRTELLAGRIAVSDLPKEVQSIAQQLLDSRSNENSPSTKFSQYTLPNGENYKELLLTMPNKADDKIAEINNKLQAISNQSVKWHQEHPESKKEYDELLKTKQDLIQQSLSNYKSTHFDEPNILAHIRFDERTDSQGRKTLHIAELQSDWGQEGRKKGFAVSEANKAKKIALDKKGREQGFNSFTASENQWYDDYVAGKFGSLNTTNQNAVPDMPFKKSWHELAFKKALRFAVENNFDAISWDTGETQADRYDLAKVIDSVSYSPEEKELTYTLRDKPHEEPQFQKGVELDQLPDYIGKELAQKLIDENNQNSYGEYELELPKGERIGGNGMKGFYDQILPKFANKYVKKWGAKVESGRVRTGKAKELNPVLTWMQENDIDVNDPDFGVQMLLANRAPDWVIDAVERGDINNDLDLSQTQDTTLTHSIVITPEMKASVMQGQPLFKVRTDEDLAEQNDLRSLETLESIIPGMESKITPNGVEINAQTAEALRRIGAVAFGKDIAKSDSIQGQFQDPKQTQTYLGAIDDTIDSLTELGYDAGDVKGLTELRNNLDKWQSEHQGTAKIIVFDDAIKHETGHEIDYLEAIPEAKELRNRVGGLNGKGSVDEFLAIKDVEGQTPLPDILDTAYQNFFSKYDYNENDKGVLVQETWNYIQTQDGEKLGLTPEQEATFAYFYMKAYVAKNGTKVLDIFAAFYKQFELDSSHLEKVRNEIKNQKESESVPDTPRPEKRDKSPAETGNSIIDEKDNSAAETKSEQDRRYVAGISEGQSGAVDFEPDGKVKLSQTPISLRDKGEIPLEDRTYVSVTNAGQVAFANKKLDEGIEKAQKWFDDAIADKQYNDGATTAVGLSLMTTYGAKGDIDSLNKTADKLIPSITEAAQAVQAMSLVGMFDPNTAGAYATKIAKQRTGKDITQSDYEKAVDIAQRSADIVRNEANSKAVIELLQEQNQNFTREIESLEKSLQLSTQGKMAYRLDFEQAQKEIAKLQKKLEEKKAERSKPTTQIVKDINERKNEILARLQQRFGDKPLMMVSESENQVLYMVAPTDSNLSKQDYNDLVDWATFTLDNGLKNGMTPDDFLKTINGFTKNELSLAQISDIHADAISRLKGERKDLDFKQRELARNRLSHYKMAEDWSGKEAKLAKQSARKITPDSSAQKIIEGILNSDADAVTQATAILRTNKRPSEVVAYLQNTEKLSHTDAMKVLRDADNLWHQVKDDIRKTVIEKKADKKLNDEDIANIEAEKKANDRAKRQLANEASRFYDALSKKSWELGLQTVVDYGRATLLYHPKTHLINIISNVGQQIAEVPENFIAGAMDTVLSKARSRNRTVAIDVKGVKEGFKAVFKQDESMKNADYESGIKQAWNIIKFGDTEDNFAKLNLRESNLSARKDTLPRKMIDAYINYSFRTLGAEDALFKAYAFRKAIEELAKVNSLNNKGTKEDLVTNPTPTMIIQAIEFADEMTYQEDNVVSRNFNAVKNVLGRSAPVSKYAIESAVPFVTTPTNIVLQTLYNSPLGFGKAAYDLVKMLKPGAFKRTRQRFENKYYKAVKDEAQGEEGFLKLSPERQRAKVKSDLDELFKDINQREFARTFSKATFGSSLWFLGMYLASQGLMAGITAPDDDDKDETGLFFARRKAGIEARSLDTGLVRFVLPQSPALNSMTYGATLQDYLKLGEKKDVFANSMSAMSEVGKDMVFEQPLLKEASQVFNSRAAAAENVGGYIVPRFVPFGRIIDSIGEVTDETARKRTGYFKPNYKKHSFWDIQWTGFRNATASKFPLLRQYADESTTSVSPQERGGAMRRFVRTFDPFNTRSSTLGKEIKNDKPAKLSPPKLKETIKKPK